MNAELLRQGEFIKAQQDAVNASNAILSDLSTALALERQERGKGGKGEGGGEGKKEERGKREGWFERQERGGRRATNCGILSVLFFSHLEVSTSTIHCHGEVMIHI